MDKNGNILEVEAEGAMDSLDSITHMIYLPTSEFETAAAGARPRSKSGTFMIVVVGR